MTDPGPAGNVAPAGRRPDPAREARLEDHRGRFTAAVLEVAYLHHLNAEQAIAFQETCRQAAVAYISSTTPTTPILDWPAFVNAVWASTHAATLKT